MLAPFAPSSASCNFCLVSYRQQDLLFLGQQEENISHCASLIRDYGNLVTRKKGKYGDFLEMLFNQEEIKRKGA